METKSTNRIPAYVPFSTFQTAILSRTQGVPNRLDPKLFDKMGGTLRNHLFASLKFLGLIDDEHNTSTELRQLVKMDEAHQKTALKEILTRRYSFVFNDKFDFENAGDSEIREKFEAAGASNDTLRKAISFFLKACEFSGIKVSPHLVAPGRQPSSKPRKAKRDSSAPVHESKEHVGDKLDTKHSLSFEGEVLRLSKLAEQITSWTDEERKFYLRLITSVFNSAN